MIDLTACTFIDSLGVAVLVEASAEMRKRGRVVAIVCRSPQVRRTLALTGVDEQIPICWTREDAIELLADPHQGFPKRT
jgi:anti-anti-sigma factor